MANPFGGYKPGYNDPLSQPFRGMGNPAFGGPQMGFGAALPSAGGGFSAGHAAIPAPTGGPAVGGGKRSVGSYLTGALDWLTDEDQGANRQNLMLSGVGMGLGYMGQRADRNEEKRQMERAEGLDDERRERVESLQPIMSPYLMDLLRKRQGGG